MYSVIQEPEDLDKLLESGKKLWFTQQAENRAALVKQTKILTRGLIDSADSLFRNLTFAKPIRHEALHAEGMAITKQNSIILFSIVPFDRANPAGRVIPMMWPIRDREFDFKDNKFKMAKGALDSEMRNTIGGLWSRFVHASLEATDDTDKNGEHMLAFKEGVLIPEIPNLSLLLEPQEWDVLRSSV